MQGKGAPLPLQPIPKSNHNTKTKTKNNNKIKVVYTENLTDPLVLEIFHNSLRLRRGHQDSRTQTPNRLFTTVTWLFRLQFARIVR